jgi:hypothetical protein
MKKTGLILLVLLSLALVSIVIHAEEATTPTNKVGQGADMRVVIYLHISSKSIMKYIDASSKQTGDYQNEFVIKDAAVYLTDEGKALIEKYSKEDETGNPLMLIQKNGTWLSDWWDGVVEEGIGKE